MLETDYLSNHYFILSSLLEHYPITFNDVRYYSLLRTHFPACLVLAYADNALDIADLKSMLNTYWISIKHMIQLTSEFLCS